MHITNVPAQGLSVFSHFFQKSRYQIARPAQRGVAIEHDEEESELIAWLNVIWERILNQKPIKPRAKSASSMADLESLSLNTNITEMMPIARL